jgi:hypothetical protein
LKQHRNWPVCSVKRCGSRGARLRSRIRPVVAVANLSRTRVVGRVSRASTAALCFPEYTAEGASCCGEPAAGTPQLDRAPLARSGRRDKSAAIWGTPVVMLRWSGRRPMTDAVEKVGCKSRSRNNRIERACYSNQHCAGDWLFEPKSRCDALKILFQQYRPEADFAAAQLATPISTRLNGRFSIKEAYGCRRLDQRERLASNRAARPSAIDRQTSHVFGVNSTLPPLCAAFVIASWTSSKP